MTAETRTRGDGVKRVFLRLFVAGDAPNSLMAKENLERFLERAAANSNGAEIEVEIVDALANPAVMTEHGIYLTPALQIVEPAPVRLIYGNLSDAEALRILPFRGDR